MLGMSRREFIALVCGATAAWPFGARAQQGERMRRIGVLMSLGSNNPEGHARLGAFLEALQQFGWTDGHNIRIDTRWSEGDAERTRRYAAELVALAPNVIFASGGSTVGPLQQASRTIPIVFANVTDPVGAGFVASLSRPGGNATGFTLFEYGISAKWLELLKQIAPRVSRVAVIRDPSNPVGLGQWGAMQSVAPSLGVELRPISVHDAGEIESSVTAFERGSDGGLIVLSGASGITHRDLIIKLAARHRLPAVYPYRFFVTAGGLMSYGPNTIEPDRRAASYVDRILKGEKPADLPVQTPTKYHLVINVKTANAHGLEISPSLLARADEVIE